MPKDYPRSLRVSEQLRRELTLLVRNSVRDPRVSEFAISEVVVSKDLSAAKVYYTPYSSNPDLVELQQGLEKATPFLRKELGRLLRLRIVPHLSFVYDDSLDRSSRLDVLLSKNRLPLEESEDTEPDQAPEE